MNFTKCAILRRNPSCLLQNAHQRLYFPQKLWCGRRRVLRSFYICVVESVLSASINILPTITDIFSILCWKRTPCIKDPQPTPRIPSSNISPQAEGEGASRAVLQFEKQLHFASTRTHPSCWTFYSSALHILYLIVKYKMTLFYFHFYKDLLGCPETSGVVFCAISNVCRYENTNPWILELLVHILLSYQQVGTANRGIWSLTNLLSCQQSVSLALLHHGNQSHALHLCDREQHPQKWVISARAWQVDFKRSVIL